MVSLLRLSTISSIFMAIALQVANGVAQDWPKALGPSHDCRSDFRLPTDWSIDQVNLVWEIDAGEGYSGAIGVAGNAFLFDRSEKSLRLRSIRVSDGRENWTRQWPAKYPGGFDPDKGPRATPCYSDGRIFAWSAAGTLICVSAEAGKIIWQNDLADEYPGGDGYFGHGGGPIVIDDTVMVNVGSRKAAIVGVDVETGKVQWIAGSDQASYAAPISVKLGEKSLALFITRLNFFVVDPKNGDILASSDFGKRGATVNAASPVVVNGKQVFLNAAYGIGAKMLQLPELSKENQSEMKLDVVWQDEKAYASQYATPIHHEGYLYGTTGREDFDDGQLRCIRASDGTVMWSEKDWSLAHGIKLGDKTLFLSLDSELAVAQLSPEANNIVAKRKLAPNATRPLPALINDCLVFRTTKTRDNPNPKWYGYKLVK